MSWRSKKIMKSTKAGLKMPVGRIQKKLKKGKYAPRISACSSVFMAAVLEFLTAEIMDVAGEAAKENKKRRISPKHLLLAVKHDAELNKLLRGSIISQEDVLPLKVSEATLELQPVHKKAIKCLPRRNVRQQKKI